MCEDGNRTPLVVRQGTVPALACSYGVTAGTEITKMQRAALKIHCSTCMHSGVLDEGAKSKTLHTSVCCS